MAANRFGLMNSAIIKEKVNVFVINIDTIDQPFDKF